MRDDEIDWEAAIAHTLDEERPRPNNTGLLPPEQFSEVYAGEEPDVPGGRGPASDVVEGVITSACGGWAEPPTPGGMYEAVRAEWTNDRQRSIAHVLIAEATHSGILLAYLQQAFTWRQLARRMHASGHYRGELAAHVNLHAERA